MKKGHFQTVIFALIFVIMNGHASKPFKIILNDVQTMSNGEMYKAHHHYYKKYFDTLKVEGLIKKEVLSIPQLAFTGWGT